MLPPYIRRLPLLAALLLFIGLEASGVLLAQAANNDCPVYSEELRITIVSSSRGQLFDSGWQPGNTFASCDPIYRTDPTPAPVCKSVVLPGPSLGQNDEMITTCVAHRYKCVAKCACVASTATTETKVQFPNTEFLTSKLSAVAKAAPMIKKMTFAITGQVSLKRGEECCLPAPALNPVKWSEYSGSVKAGLTVELQVPGWGWTFDNTWEGLYKVNAEISLGPTVSVEPSATVSMTGKAFDGAVCPGCLTTALVFDVGVKIKFGGVVAAKAEILRWPYWKFDIGANASAELASSINGGGQYATGAGCQKAGLSGTLGYGKVEGTASIGASFMGWELSQSWGITLLPGFSTTF
jgi:hypothetical protein